MACRASRSRAKSPNDVAWLERSLTETVVEALGGSEFPAATRLRHRELLTEAATAPAPGAAREDTALELAAEDVRLAARALDRITGRIDPEGGAGPDLRDLLHRQVTARRCFT